MSKGLEALTRIKDSLINIQCKLLNDNCNDERVLSQSQLDDYYIVALGLYRLEKLEKVVEILKDKFQLDIEENGYFGCIDLDYNSINPDELSKEQYDLLKEMFGDEN